MCIRDRPPPALPRAPPPRGGGGGSPRHGRRLGLRARGMGCPCAARPPPSSLDGSALWTQGVAPLTPSSQPPRCVRSPAARRRARPRCETGSPVCPSASNARVDVTVHLDHQARAGDVEVDDPSADDVLVAHPVAQRLAAQRAPQAILRWRHLAAKLAGDGHLPPVGASAPLDHAPPSHRGERSALQSEWGGALAAQGQPMPRARSTRPRFRHGKPPPPPRGGGARGSAGGGRRDGRVLQGTGAHRLGGVEGVIGCHAASIGVRGSKAGDGSPTICPVTAWTQYTALPDGRSTARRS